MVECSNAGGIKATFPTVESYVGRAFESQQDWKDFVGEGWGVVEVSAYTR
jgi:hypothetical protein